MRKIIILSFLCLFLTPQLTLQAQTIYVGPARTYTTIQAGIDAAADGDTVIVDPGTYTGPGNRDIDFLGKAITVKSETGPENCIIDCQGTETEPHRGFNFSNNQDANAVIDGFTIINAFTQNGAIIDCRDNQNCILTISNCNIHNNTSSGTTGVGGAISILGGISFINNCKISDNNSLIGGGIYCENGDISITGCTVNDNLTENRYGGICCRQSNAAIKNCTVTGNFSDMEGSGIYCRGDSISIENCNVAGNSAYMDGGGIYCEGDSISIENCNVTGNWSNDFGGIRCGGNAAIKDCNVAGNSARYGGSGGISCGGTVEINNCNITGNSSDMSGGGICCGGTITITDCIITDNSSGYYGGGIYCLGTVKIANSNISGNSAGEYGGGIYCHYNTTTTITNCTITANKTEADWFSDSSGGGIYCKDDHPITVINSTICDNSDVRCGIYCQQGQILNCIIRNNSSDEIWKYSDVSVAYSNIEGGWPGQGNIDTDPAFAFETDYHIMPNSPCIDAGDPLYVPGPNETDLDGNPRVSAGRIDMGAYEYNPTQPSLVVYQNTFFFLNDWPQPAQQKLLIRNCGGGTLNWQITENCDWLDVSPTSGASTGQVNEVALSVNPDALTAGSYNCILTVSDLNAVNSPVTVDVRFNLGGILRVPNQFTTIQQAIDAAEDYDVVLVDDGIYTGDGNRDLQLTGKSITIRGENGPQNTIIDCNGTENDPHRGFNFTNNTNTNAIFAGFTIKNGFVLVSNDGAGIDCKNNLSSTLTISECNITENTVLAGRGGYGGGISVIDGIYFINNCHISNNFSSNGGGISSGYWCWPYEICNATNLTINNCSISNNSADNGGGIYCGASTVKIKNTAITSNSADYFGGGLYCYGEAPTTITNCNISGNSSVYHGGGCLNEGNTTKIKNSVISNNSAARDGGGCLNIGTLIISNCTFTGNAALNGYALATGYSKKEYQSVLLNVSNSILWDGGNEIYDNSILGSSLKHEIVASYSNIRGGWPGTGNIDIDPLFIWQGHLQKNSPCVNTGDPNYIPGPNETDLDGNPRIIDGRIDMGAYEYNHQTSIAVSSNELSFYMDWPKPAPQTLFISNGGDGTLNWNIIEDCNWLELSTTSGTSTGQFNEVIITVDQNNLSRGYYSYLLKVSDPNAANNPVTVQVHFYVGSILPVPQQFDTIQAAVDAAEDYDLVLVADGTYTGQGNYDIDFHRKAIIIRSENGPDNCIIDCQNQGSGFYSEENDIEGPLAIIDGFTIVNGSAQKGGAVCCCNYRSLTITNCIINNNNADSGWGGGIFCSTGRTLKLSNCTVSNNSARTSGGIYLHGYRDAAITNCTITGNTAIYGRGSDGSGGGISILDGIYSINNCIINGNKAARGGGIACTDGTIRITNSITCGNMSTEDAGGIYLLNSVSTVKNCSIIGNRTGTSRGYGGGIYCFNGINTTLTNCTFAQNSAYAYNGNALAHGCSYGYPKNIKITNCILWDGGYEISSPDESKIIVTYSNIQDRWLWPGPGNINSDPCFVAQGYWDSNGTPGDIYDDFWVDGDYHLLPSSLCIDTGEPCYISETNESDLDGNPRVIGSRIDMGAYEFNNNPVANAGPNTTAYAEPNGIARVTLDGTGSYDDDGQPLIFLWTWTIDGNDYDADGPTPTIQLPVGEHIIQLIVSDGIDDSEPDEVTITVVPPLEVPMKLTPRALNRTGGGRLVKAHFVLPEGFSIEDVDADTPAVIAPFGVQSYKIKVMLDDEGLVRVVATFSRSDLCSSITGYDRNIELMVIGRLTTGRYFYGTSFVTIIGRKHPRQLRLLKNQYTQTRKLKSKD